MVRLLLFPSLVLFFLFCVHVNPPKRWRARVVVAIKWRHGRRVSTVAFFRLPDGANGGLPVVLWSCPAPTFSLFLSPTGNVYKVDKKKKMPRAILRFITLSQTDQRSFCTHPPAIQCLCSDVLGATQNHFDVFQSVNKETMVVPPFARLSRKQNRQRAAGPLAGREKTLAVV
jgi:hypothetical protein